MQKLDRSTRRQDMLLRSGDLFVNGDECRRLHANDTINDRIFKVAPRWYSWYLACASSSDMRATALSHTSPRIT